MTDVIVIGGGHNGLVCAAYLARAGRQVTVLEASETLGGIAAPIDIQPGYTVPGLVHDTQMVAADVVKDLELVRHGLALNPNAPSIYLPEKGTNGLVLHADPMAATSELEQHASADVSAYQEFKSFITRMRKGLKPLMSSEPPDLRGEGMAQLWKMGSLGLGIRRLGRADMSEFLRVPPMPVADWLDEYFQHPAIKFSLAMSAVQSTFAGPRSPGTAANLLLGQCLSGASVQGGPAALIGALVACCEESGVSIQRGTRVSEVISGQLMLENGDRLDAQSIVSSVNPHTTLLELLARSEVAPSLVREAEGYRTNGNLAKVHIAANAPVVWDGRNGERFERIQIGGSMQALEQAFDATKYGEVAPSLCLDVSVPTVSTPALAPEGHELLSVIVHFAPYHLEGGWTDERRHALGQAVVEHLSEHASGLRDSIVAVDVMSPVDMESRFSLAGGHLFHGDHALDQLLPIRPTPSCVHHRTPLDGIYLCGAGTHPGGGLTGLCGKLGAQAVLG